MNPFYAQAPLSYVFTFAAEKMILPGLAMNAADQTWRLLAALNSDDLDALLVIVAVGRLSHVQVLSDPIRRGKATIRSFVFSTRAFNEYVLECCMHGVMDEAVTAQRITLLTPAEAAAVLRISPKTLERHATRWNRTQVLQGRPGTAL
jgi:hypothetical protein